MKAHALQTDAKGRLNLGKRYASSYFLVEEVDNGEFTVKKAAVIPEHELWLYQNKEALNSVLRGVQQAREMKLERNAIDLDALSSMDSE